MTAETKKIKVTALSEKLENGARAKLHTDAAFLSFRFFSCEAVR
jgi:hypothetical protein